jgi:hypothetical protein
MAGDVAWRFRHGVGPEPRSGMEPGERTPPRYITPQPVWSCPSCGSTLRDDQGGMRCHGCERHWTWAELRASETGD